MILPDKNKVFSRLEKVISSWSNDLLKFEDNKISHKINETEWCLAELYDHIIRVARSYQLPNFEQALLGGEKKKAKNLSGYIVFDLNIIPPTKIQMEKFPTKIKNNFTPVIRLKKELLNDLSQLALDVSEIIKHNENTDLNSKKHHHPFFGHITAKEWIMLIEIHMRHHERQRQRIIRRIN